VVSPKLESVVDTYDARVHLKTLWIATEMVRKGALTNSLMKTSFDVSDKAFNKFMAGKAATDANTSSIGVQHMFEWGSTHQGIGTRLWKTFMTGNNSSRYVGVTFIDSRRKVPLTPKTQKQVSRHVFIKKARMLENAEEVTIKPKKTFLVYEETLGQSVSKKNPKGNLIFTKKPTGPQPAGMGKFKNNFQNAFNLWWGSIGQENMEDVAKFLGESFAVRSARVKAAKTRIQNYKSQINRDETPEATRRAKEMIAAIEKQMTRHGRGK